MPPTSTSTEPSPPAARSAVPPTGLPSRLPDPIWPPGLPPRRRPAISRRTAVIALVVALGIVSAVAVCLYLDSPPAFLDLSVYREGVQAWWRGQNVYGTLPPTFGNDTLPFIYPPFALLFLGPVVALPWSISTVVMLAISLSSLAVVVYLSVRHVGPDLSRPAVLAATAGLVSVSLALEPVEDTLWFGQVNLLLMLLVTLDCLPARTRWPRGILVGVAAAVKLTPIVFLLYFLLRKDYRAAATAAVSALTATAIGFLVSWHGSLQFWFGHSGGARTVSGSAYYSNQTVDGFLARLQLPGLEQSVLWVAMVAVVLVAAAIGIRRAHLIGDRTLAMALTGCFGLIASPTSWGHHWVYVVPGVIAMGAYSIRHRSRGWAVACGVTGATFVLGPFRFLTSTNGAYLHWNPVQQIIGNSYIIVGIALLVAFAIPALPTLPLLRAARSRSRPR